jgi:hypothetical protein
LAENDNKNFSRNQPSSQTADANHTFPEFIWLFGLVCMHRIFLLLPGTKY